LFEALPLGEELLLSRALSATEEQAMKTGKERCCISHA
jgi:hypothetical protein